MSELDRISKLEINSLIKVLGEMGGYSKEKIETLTEIIYVSMNEGKVWESK